MMFTSEHSVLVIVDVQGKLAQVMHEREKVYKNIICLIKAAKILNIPIIFTEQVPEKIGRTVPLISRELGSLKPIAKASFSCCGSVEFLQKLSKLNRQQIILAGIEAHVCVYQTVTELLERRFKVQVVVDSISSRTKENKDAAVERMESNGAIITSAEMLVCELLRTSEHKNFREIMQLIK